MSLSKNLLFDLADHHGSHANELGITTYSMTGFDGGKLKEMTQGTNVHVESVNGAYGLVEDAHLAICHVVTECVRAQRG